MYNIRVRCKQKAIPYNLSREDFASVPDLCPILGIPLIIGAGKNHPNLPSIDRIRPYLGYVVGNIRWISLRANTLKRDATAAELQMVADDAKKLGY
jgi:hypothetical protein